MNQPAKPTETPTTAAPVEQAAEDYEIGIPDMPEDKSTPAVETPPVTPAAPATPEVPASETGQTAANLVPDPSADPKPDTEDGPVVPDEIKDAQDAFSKLINVDPQTPEKPPVVATPESESPTQTDQYLEVMRDFVKDNPEQREKVEAVLAGKGLTLDPTKASENSKEIGELKDIVKNLAETVTGEKVRTDKEKAHTELYEAKSKDFDTAMKAVPDYAVEMVEQMANDYLGQNFSLDQVTLEHMQAAVNLAVAKVNHMVTAGNKSSSTETPEVPPALGSSDGLQDPNPKPPGEKPEEEQSADQWLEAGTKEIVQHFKD